MTKQEVINNSGLTNHLIIAVMESKLDKMKKGTTCQMATNGKQMLIMKISKNNYSIGFYICYGDKE